MKTFPDGYKKFALLGLVVALALASRIAYPALYPPMESDGAGVPTTANGTSSYSLTALAPLFVLPSSSTSISATAATIGNADASSPPQDQAGTTTTPFTDFGGTPAPSIMGEASLVADLETGTAFASVNPDHRWPLASLTKLMTASVVIDDMSMSDEVTVPAAAVAVDPSQALLSAGETFTVSDLLHMLLMPSSNVAAETLADYYGRAQFIAQMNARAANWGMTSTHYDDPSGLSAGNESTAGDLLLLAGHIYADYPQILAITDTREITAKDLTSGKAVDVVSINDFAGRSDFIGGKTGFTNEADGNLLSIFRYEGRPILVIVMGTDDGDRFKNTLTLYNWFVQDYK